MDTRLRRGNRPFLALYLAMGSRGLAGKLNLPLFISLIIGITLTGCEKTPPLKKLDKNAIIVAFGDSLTVGVGANAHESYPAILEQLSHRTVVNAGVSGETSDAGLSRLADVINEFSPQLLIICHGGNDFLQKKPIAFTQANLRAMVELARSRHIDVVLVAVPEFNLWAKPAELYNNLATEFHLPIENKIVSDLEKSPEMKSDYIHFNAKGYRAMAVAIHQLLIDAHALKH